MLREWSKVTLFILLLCLPALLSAGELPKGCLNEIQSLGGKNAVIRTKDDPKKRFDTREKLDAALFSDKRADGKPNKIPGEINKLLEEQGIKLTVEQIKEKLKDVTMPVPFENGEVFEWMAVRRDGKLGVVTAGCWGGPEPFLGWAFKHNQDGIEYSFVIPVDCLNLALLKRKNALFCKVKIEASCGQSKANVKLDWSPGLKLVTTQDLSLSDDTSGSAIREVSVSEGKPIAIEATVERAGGDSATCSAAALVCPAPKSCNSACKIKLETSWDGNQATIRVLKDGKVPDNCDQISVSVGGKKLEPESGLGCVLKTSEEGDIIAVYESEGSEGACSSKCEATTELKRPSLPPPPACCDENWLVRGVGIYSGTHGSATEFGTNPPVVTHIDTSAGAGLGIEAEYFWEDESREGRTLPGKGWGVPMGVTYSELRYSYMRDTPEVWIMDEEDTSAFFVYSGISRRFELGEKARASIGPVIGLYRSGDASFIDVGSKTLDLDFGWSFAYGANVTFDWYLDECWGITFGATYLEAEVDDGIDIEINPLLFRFGVVNRF